MTMFTDEQRQAILDALRKRIPTNGRRKLLRSCVVCGKNRWMINETLSLVNTAGEWEEAGIAVDRGRGTPLIAILCKNCGNTHFLNPILLGVAEDLRSNSDG